MLLVAAALLALAATGAPARSLPANVHPAVAALLATQPGGTVSLIVGKQAGATGLEAAAERLGARVTARWSFINAFAADLPVRAVPALAALPGVKMVLRNQSVATTARTPGGGTTTTTGAVNTANLLNAYNYSVRADKVWASGYDGKGVTVAVVDSGIASGMQDFGNRVLQTVKVNSTAIYAADRYGHGTHVAGIIGGNGALSGGNYIGIAPGVNLISVKFSDDNGTAAESDLVSALQWVYDNRAQYNIRVVNVSANAGAQSSYKESPTAAAVEQLWFAGVVVVVSAGNRGGAACAVCYAPANDPYVITAGAVTDAGTKSLTDDVAVAWSSYGTTLDNHIKPDVVAPGARIISLMSGSTLRDSYPTNAVDTSYFTMGGTSMSAPVVTGTVALMLQARPTLTPNQVKWLLMNTTRTYKSQPARTPGIIQADLAAFYSGTPGVANLGLTPSLLLNTVTNAIDYSNAMWANAMWANAMWANNLSY